VSGGERAPAHAHAERRDGPPPRVGVLTVSSSRAASGGSDESGDALAELVAELGGEVAARELVADDRGEIERLLRGWADELRCDLVLTTGGTGLTLDDVTPEATAAVIDRPAPGIAEAMRAASEPHTRYWMLSRATAGARGRTLIVNFPGNPKAIAQTGAAIAAVLPHAIALLRR
jgi:molybdenum cofactor synthesis domain-containing protein